MFGVYNHYILGMFLKIFMITILKIFIQILPRYFFLNSHLNSIVMITRYRKLCQYHNQKHDF